MGTFKTNCAHCGTRVEVDDIYTGSRTQCPGCGQMMDLIPEQAPPPPPVTPPAQAQEFSADTPASGGSDGGYGGSGNGYHDDYGGRPPRGNADVEAAIDRLGDRITSPGSVSFFTKLADFFCFRRMIVPSLVIALGVVTLVICIIWAIVKFCQGEFFWGLAVLLGWLALRMIYEFFMVLFAINDTLTTIKNQNLRK